MRISSSCHEERSRSLRFLLWGWAMLLVVLLSAAPTGAQPRTRYVGSAFDPASVSVGLSPKKLRLAASASASERRKDTDEVADLAPPGFASEPLVVAAAEPSLDRSPRDRRYGILPRGRAFPGASGPRAPPA